MKASNPSKELKNLFKELVAIKTAETKRRDWSLITFKEMTPFNNYTLISLMVK